MRLLAAVLVVAAVACSKPEKERVAIDPSERASTLDVSFVDTFDGAPATHVAVGGKVRVRVPDLAVTATSTMGPFLIAGSSSGIYTITAIGAGTGEIEIETVTGYTRIAMTSASIEDVSLQFDPSNERNATILLRDAAGKRLVDSTLRIASGSAPVSFRDSWDHIVFQTLPPGAVLVKTDLLGATRAKVEKIATRESLAKR